MIGDRKHPHPAYAYQRQHAPGATAVGTVPARALQNAYSMAQYAGLHCGAVVQPVKYRGPSDHMQYFNVQDHTVFSERVYIPEHWDGITAHVSFGSPEAAVVPRFRLRINAVNGLLSVPSTEPVATVDEQVEGSLWDLYSHTWSMDLPAITLPGTYTVEIQADGNAEDVSSDRNRFTLLGAELWGRVDG